MTARRPLVIVVLQAPRVGQKAPVVPAVPQHPVGVRLGHQGPRTHPGRLAAMLPVAGPPVTAQVVLVTRAVAAQPLVALALQLVGHPVEVPLAAGQLLVVGQQLAEPMYVPPAVPAAGKTPRPIGA